MGSRLNTEEIIKRSKAKHPGKFTYECTAYTISTEPMKFHCVEHGIITITYTQHMNGEGCPHCSRQKQINTISMTEQVFLSRSLDNYGDQYNYSLVEYKDIHSKVKIICPIHGVFEQAPRDHLKGGCNKCAKIKARETVSKNRAKTFISDCEKVHGAVYDLSLVEYNGCHSKISVICQQHGVFKTRPHCFLRGSGCKKCAKNGYRPNRGGFLYVLSTSCGMTKIGITNNKPAARAVKVASTSGKDFKVEHTYFFEDGEIPYNIEDKLLLELRQEYKQPVEKFDGFTECFYSVDQTKLLSRIEQLIQEHKDAHQQQ